MTLAPHGHSGADEPGTGWTVGESYNQEPGFVRLAEDHEAVLAKGMVGIREQ